MARKKKPVPYEEAFQRLQSIVEQLEQGEDSLDNTLELFEEGVGLIKACRKQLEEAQQRVEKVVSDSDGSLKLEELD